MAEVAVADAHLEAGAAHHESGRYKEAEACYHEAMKLYFCMPDNILAMKGPDAMNRLALLFDHTGRYAESMSTYKMMISLCKGRSTPMGAILINMGASLFKQGKTQEAGERYEEALAILKENLGENDPSVGTALVNLGSAYTTAGDYDKGMNSYQKALEIFTMNDEKVGSDKPYITGGYEFAKAQVLANMGTLYLNKGTLDRSMECQQEALAAFRKLFGEKHTNVATACQNIGAILHKKGPENYDEALRFYKKALKIQEKLSGSDNLEAAQAILAIGKVLYDMKRYSDALPRFEHALKIFDECISKENPHSAYAHFKVAGAKCSGGNVEEGLVSARESVRIFKKLGLVDTPQGAQAITYLDQMEFYKMQASMRGMLNSVNSLGGAR